MPLRPILSLVQALLRLNFLWRRMSRKQLLAHTLGLPVVCCLISSGVLLPGWVDLPDGLPGGVVLSRVIGVGPVLFRGPVLPRLCELLHELPLRSVLSGRVI